MSTFRLRCLECRQELLTTPRVDEEDVERVHQHLTIVHPTLPLPEPFSLSAALRLVSVEMA